MDYSMAPPFEYPTRCFYIARWSVGVVGVIGVMGVMGVIGVMGVMSVIRM